MSRGFSIPAFAYLRHRLAKSFHNRSPLAAMLFLLFANAISVAQVFPYGPQMVKWLKLTDDDRALGYFAGFYLAAYMLGNFLSAIPLGVLADRWGRKKVVLLGLWACTLPQVAFGMSTSFFMALVARFLMGLPNAIVGTAKAMAPDICRPEDQALAMSLIAASWGLGNIFGPAMGGLLVDLWPASLPYLLPNLIGAIIALVAIVTTHRYLPERSATTGLAASDSRDGPAQPVPSAAIELEAAAEAPTTAMPKSSPRSCFASLMPTKRARGPVILYTIMAFSEIIGNEVIPLFCYAPISSGGLELHVTQVGGLLTAMGCAILIFQMLLLPMIMRRISAVSLLRYSNLAQAPIYFLIPNVSLLPRPLHIPC